VAFFCQISFGKEFVTKTAQTVTAARITYTRCPPSRFRCSERAKREVDAAGPIALMTETQVCDKPFVAPRDRSLGAEARMYILIVPKSETAQRKDLVKDH